MSAGERNIAAFTSDKEGYLRILLLWSCYKFIQQRVPSELGKSHISLSDLPLVGPVSFRALTNLCQNTLRLLFDSLNTFDLLFSNQVLKLKASRCITFEKAVNEFDLVWSMLRLRA